MITKTYCTAKIRFFFSLLILTQSSDIETDARLNSGENNANMNFATSNLSTQLDHKGKHKLERMNILKSVKWSARESKVKFRWGLLGFFR